LSATPKDGQKLVGGKVELHEYDGFALITTPRSQKEDLFENDKTLAPCYVKFYKYEEIKEKFYL
jgi:hypothetical protein